MPVWLQAGLWGFVAGAALLIGAAIAYFIEVPQRIIAGIMAFGSGVLISALSFDLMDEAYKRGGFDSTAVGFLGGAAVYTFAGWILARQGAKHRKRSGGQQASEAEDSGSGLAIAMALCWMEFPNPSSLVFRCWVAAKFPLSRLSRFFCPTFLKDFPVLRA